MSGDLVFRGGFSSSGSITPESNHLSTSHWFSSNLATQRGRLENGLQNDRCIPAVDQINRWCNLVKIYCSQGIPMSNNLLFRLATFLERTAVLIRHLSEANLDLCVFCRNNNETFEMYTSHKVKDRSGRVACPVLRRFVCPLCSATGDYAHTIRYCPLFLHNSAISTLGSSTPSRLSDTAVPTIPRRVTGTFSDVVPNGDWLVDQFLREMSLN